MQFDYRPRKIRNGGVSSLCKLLASMILWGEPRHVICVSLCGAENFLKKFSTHLDLQVINAPKLAQPQSLGLQAKDRGILACGRRLLPAVPRALLVLHPDVFRAAGATSASNNVSTLN